MGVPRGHFTHIFIDEAGQTLEPEAMISIRTLASSETNVILAGDPKQLGPIVHSGVADALGLGVSYLDRLMDREVYRLDTGTGKTCDNYHIDSILMTTYMILRISKSCQVNAQFPKSS